MKALLITALLLYLGIVTLVLVPFSEKHFWEEYSVRGYFKYLKKRFLGL